jgi:hypothetical protein
MLFDIVEPRHPCNEKPTVVSDISLRLSEGIQELKLEQQLAPTREAISRTLTAGSTGFLKAVEGVRGRWQRTPSSNSSLNNGDSASSISSTPVELSTPSLADSNIDLAATPKDATKPGATPPQQTPSNMARQHSVDLGTAATNAAIEAKAAIGAWGAGIGSFLNTRASRFSIPKVGTAFAAVASPKSSAAPSPVTLMQTPPPNPGVGSLPMPPLTPPSKVEVPTFTPAPVAATTTVTSPSRVKAAVSAVEARRPTPKTEKESRAEPSMEDLNGMHPTASPAPFILEYAQAEEKAMHAEESTLSSKAL